MWPNIKSSSENTQADNLDWTARLLSSLLLLSPFQHHVLHTSSEHPPLDPRTFTMLSLVIEAPLQSQSSVLTRLLICIFNTSNMRTWEFLDQESNQCPGWSTGLWRPAPNCQIFLEYQLPAAWKNHTNLQTSAFQIQKPPHAPSHTTIRHLNPASAYN